MHYDRERVVQRMRKWEAYLKEHALPLWEELPQLDLYMDQVVALINSYLGFLPKEVGMDAVVTAAAINNYVRKKIVPAPIKKRYSRIHLAYLLMICTLKQTMTIAQIQKIIPVGLDEAQVQSLYSNYAARHARMSNDFIALVRRGARPVLDADNHSEDTPVENMVTSLALMSGYCRLLAEKIVELQDYTADEVIDGQPLPKKVK